MASPKKKTGGKKYRSGKGGFGPAGGKVRGDRASIAASNPGLSRREKTGRDND